MYLLVLGAIYFLGCGAMLTSYVIYKFNGNSHIKNHIFLWGLSTLSLSLILSRIYVQNILNLPEGDWVIFALSSSYVVGNGTTYFMVKFIRSLCGLSWSGGGKLLLRIYALSFLFILPGVFIFSEDRTQTLKHLDVLNLLSYLVISAAMAYSSIVLCLRGPQFKHKFMRGVRWIVSVLILLFSLLIASDLLTVYFSWDFPILNAFLIFYALHSVLQWVVGGWYLSYKGNLLGGVAEPSQNLQPYAFSSREHDILKLILAGYSNQEIADELFISISTVKTHVYNIFKKAEVSKRAQLFHLFGMSEKAQ